MSLFDYEKYFETILNKEYNHYVAFHRDKEYLIQDIVYEIQKKIDNKEDDLTVYIVPTRYPEVYTPFYLKSIPLRYEQASGLSGGFEYKINIKLKDLKNIEKEYNKITQEKLMSKEEFFKEEKERLMREIEKEQ